MTTVRGLGRAALTAALTLEPARAFAQSRSWEWQWEWHPMWWMMGAWGLGMLFMLVFWGLVIIGIVFAVRWLFGFSTRPDADAALQILRERYARGEIGKDEFDAKLRDLHG